MKTFCFVYLCLDRKVLNDWVPPYYLRTFKGDTTDYVMF